MSGLILPEGAKPGFVQGRRCKPYGEVMEHYVGWLLCLRRASDKLGVRALRSNGLVGIIFSAIPAPHYPKGLGVLLVIEAAPPTPPNPMNVAGIDVAVLEMCDAWVHPAGFPEKAVSLLQ